MDNVYLVGAGYWGSKVLEELKNVTVSEKLIDSPMTPGQHLKCKFIKFCK